MINTDTIIITPELLQLIAEIDEFKGAWRAMGALAPDRMKSLRHVATIESIGSSTRIEGSKLSDREVERLLAKLETKAFASAGIAVGDDLRALDGPVGGEHFTECGRVDIVAQIPNIQLLTHKILL